MEGFRRRRSDEDPTSPATHHHYLSTACTHGLHVRCRMTCKFCEAPCRCQCHTRVLPDSTPQM